MAANPDIIRLKYSTDGDASIVAAISPNGSHPITRGELVIGVDSGFAKLYTLDVANQPVQVVSGFPSGVDGGDFDFGAYPVRVGSRLPRLGTTPVTVYTGWTQYFYGQNGGSGGPPQFIMPFSVSFGGTAYNTLYVHRSSFVTFGSASTATTSFSASNPPANKIHIEPLSGYMTAIYYQSNQAYFRIRVEGHAVANVQPSDANLFYELTIINPAYVTGQVIELRTSGSGYTNRNGIFMIASPSSAYASAPDMLLGESWVFQGNDAGNSWTATSYRYVDT